MDIAEETDDLGLHFATVTSAAATSEWVPLGTSGGMACIDSVDANGNSTGWGSATATLLYSPDGKMICSGEDVNGDVQDKADGFAREFDMGGFVAILSGGSFSGETLRITVRPKLRR